jgi:hypothetical protein
MNVFDIGHGAVVIRPVPADDRIDSLSKEQLKQSNLSDEAVETYLRYVNDKSLGR